MGGEGAPLPADSFFSETEEDVVSEAEFETDGGSDGRSSTCLGQWKDGAEMQGPSLQEQEFADLDLQILKACRTGSSTSIIKEFKKEADKMMSFRHEWG